MRSFALALAVAAVAAGVAAATPARSAHTFLAVVPGLPTNLDPAVYQGRSTTVEIEPSWQASQLRPKPIDPKATQLPGPFGWEPYLASSFKRESDGSYT